MAETKVKRVRKQKPKYFRVKLSGTDLPKIVVSMTKKAAIDAVMTIAEAEGTDILDAGRNDWDIIDLMKAPGQTSIVREVEPLKAA